VAVLFEDDDGAVASADGGAPPVVRGLGEVDDDERHDTGNLFMY
jgi:hypothetical protein